MSDMVEYSKAKPKDVIKRLNADAKAGGAGRQAFDATMRQGVADKSQVKNRMKNRNRPKKPPQSPVSPGGQAPLSPGSPQEMLERVCDLYNWAASIKLPDEISEMNRDEMYAV